VYWRFTHFCTQQLNMSVRQIFSSIRVFGNPKFRDWNRSETAPLDRCGEFIASIVVIERHWHDHFGGRCASMAGALRY